MSIEEAIKRVEKAAENAWYWSSFSPRKRAKQFVDDFEEKLKEYSEEIKSIDPDSVSDFVKRYTDKNLEYLAAKSRTASAAVTGPAKFNYRKNNAALDREHEIGKQLWSYFDWYKKKLDKRIKRDTGYYKPDAELERQKAELKEAERIHEMNLKGNRILRKGGTNQEVRKRLEEIGVPVKDIDFYLRERTPEGKFIFGFSSTNSNARKKRIQQRIKELERKAAAVGREEPKLPIENGYIIKNREEDRLQIMFDGVPDANIRTALKKNGYRWSPKQKAWQRKLTRNAVDSLDRLADSIGVSKSAISDWDKGITEDVSKKSKELLQEYRANILKNLGSKNSERYYTDYWSIVDSSRLPKKDQESRQYVVDSIMYTKPFDRTSTHIGDKREKLDALATALQAVGYPRKGGWTQWFKENIPEPNQKSPKDTTQQRKAGAKGFMATRLKMAKRGDFKNYTPIEVLVEANKFNVARQKSGENDAKRTNKKRLSPTPENLVRWMNDPNGFDLIGVDTFKKNDPTADLKIKKEIFWSRLLKK